MYFTLTYLMFAAAVTSVGRYSKQGVAAPCLSCAFHANCIMHVCSLSRCFLLMLYVHTLHNMLLLAALILVIKQHVQKVPPCKSVHAIILIQSNIA
jgi:hypothetical protein